MKSYDKFLVLAAAWFLLCFAGVNLAFLSRQNNQENVGRSYRVEVGRIAHKIEEAGLESVDLSACSYITGVERYQGDSSSFFEGTDSDYTIRVVGGEVYRFDYITLPGDAFYSMTVMANAGMLLMAFSAALFLLFVRVRILKPFEELSEAPYELAKGNLTKPMKEYKSRFFGRFVWGVDLLRENLEQQRRREYALLKEKKTLVLSLSHDIKNPLSSIKLSARAISRGLYSDRERQTEIAEGIHARAEEIESFVTQIVKASNEDFLGLEVDLGEFYLSGLIRRVCDYYGEKLAFLKIPFSVGKFSDCLLGGDVDRAVEVLQNIMENAIKYGDGRGISLEFSKEEDCVLITVQNSGCTLPDVELPHIFDSFWRGSNVKNHEGSGLGLYICRQLMHKMNGEVFGEIKDGSMRVAAVFGKAEGKI